MPLGLVLDLSHSGFAAVLSADGESVRASEVRSGGTRHDDLGDWLESLLTRAGAAGLWNDVEWICVGLGPGSFTGIRIAMAFAQGVALPRHVPLYGFTSFEALFLSFPEATDSVAAVAANAGRFYLARGLTDPGVLTEGSNLAAPSADSVLLVPAPQASFDAVSAGYRAVLAPGDAWGYAAIAKHARGSKRDARKPYYLQLSAAEDKAAADKLAKGS
jgi:tRNA threonylcarbamoyl adenosine modification protein YeaZ